MVVSFSCGPDPISTTTYPAGDALIIEEIFEDQAIPDNIYRRTYEVTYHGEQLDLGDYDNEDPYGIVAAPPKWVAGWLVVFSSSQVFIWQPGQDPIHFNPYKAQGWNDYAGRSEWRASINGSYDYYAQDLTIQDGQWRLEYVPAFDSPTGPARIVFVSDDEGQTFSVESSQG
ncbi:MAG: hypothetical protein AAFU71_04705 [Cyanobacteria bacterium J06632_22]